MTEAPPPAPRVNATHLSIFVAALSLCTAMYQGYLNTQSVGVFSRDVTHRETMRACREAVEYFMEARLRIQRLADGSRETYGTKEIAEIAFDARRTVARFAAVATYLANFNAAQFRGRYSEITADLEKLIEAALPGNSPVSLADVDHKFYKLNEDCVAQVK